MRAMVLTQWFQNGDGVLICSTNGHRPDSPEAQLVILKILHPTD